MLPNLLPKDPLSHIVFIFDYLQLCFQDSCFSVYNQALLYINGNSIYQGETGFCDALVTLIGKSLTSVTPGDESSLILTFQDGTLFTVTSIANGPESWQYSSLGQSGVVVQNL